MSSESEFRVRAQEGPQRVAAQSPADILFYGGAAGGGKSWFLVFEAGRNAHVPNYSAIIFRRTSPELTGGGSVWEESMGLYPLLGGVPLEHRLKWRFESGAQVEFSHLQYVKDVHNHQGKQYAFIGFDELVHFEETQFWYLVSRLRSTCGVKPYMRCATNPDPDSWVRKFIDWWLDDDGSPIPERSGVVRWFLRVGDDVVWADNPDAFAKDYSDRTPISFTFIPAALEDNPALTKSDPGYKARMESLPRVERERLLGGNWNIRPAAGLYFRRSYFEFVDVAPTDVAERVRAWDRAATKPTPENPDPDWTAGVKYSRLRDGSFCIEHCELLRESPLGVERAIVNTAQADGKRVRVCQWQDPGGAGKSEAGHYTRLLSGFMVRTVKASKDKVTYAGPVSSQAEAGNIKIVKGPWNEQFLKMLESFPDPRAHDDPVDALSLAHMCCGNSDLEALRRLSKWR